MRNLTAQKCIKSTQWTKLYEVSKILYYLVDKTNLYRNSTRWFVCVKIWICTNIYFLPLQFPYFSIPLFFFLSCSDFSYYAIANNGFLYFYLLFILFIMYRHFGSKTLGCHLFFIVMLLLCYSDIMFSNVGENITIVLRFLNECVFLSTLIIIYLSIKFFFEFICSLCSSSSIRQPRRFTLPIFSFYDDIIIDRRKITRYEKAGFSYAKDTVEQQKKETVYFSRGKRRTKWEWKEAEKPGGRDRRAIEGNSSIFRDFIGLRNNSWKRADSANYKITKPP